jgi:hypothetical protein
MVRVCFVQRDSANCAQTITPDLEKVRAPLREGSHRPKKQLPRLDFIDAIARPARLHIPNIPRHLRFGRFLQLEMVATGVRSQPCRFRALASLNPSNSPFSLLTPVVSLTALLREAALSQPLSNRIADDRELDECWMPP